MTDARPFSHQFLVLQGMKISFTVLFFVLFVGVYFFSVAARMEAAIVTGQITQLVQQVIPKFLKEKIRRELASMPPNTAEDDERIGESNRAIRRTAMIFVASISAVCVSICAILIGFAIAGAIPGLIILIDGIVKPIVCFLPVMLTYDFFTKHVARGYQSLDPNAVKVRILRSIIQIIEGGG